MSIPEQLDALIARVRALPPERQALAVELLTSVVEEPAKLTADELAVLLPALEAVRRGERASEAEVAELLDQAWR